MGKRELLLIVAFLVVGGVVYQVSAPDAPAHTGRSWSDFIREVRGEVFGSRARFPVDLAVNVAVAPSIKTLDLGQLGGRVEIVGEARENIEGTAHATLLGENEADVKGAASALQVTAEADGDRLEFRLTHPDAWRLARRGRPAVDLRLKVPARLALALGATGVVEAQDVAGVTLDTARGNVTLRRIAGPVDGEQRDGTLEVSGARSVDIETRRVTVRLQGIDGDVEVEAVDGGLEGKGLTGKTTLNTQRVGVQLDGQSGALEIEGQDGRCELRDLSAELTFDGRRLPLLVEMRRPVPVTAESTDGAIELRIPSGGGITLNVRAEDGSVVVPDGMPVPKRDGTRTTLETKVAGGGPLVSLTGSRASITIKMP
jgi:hypothetical protein